jgi:hypothetical protein
VRVGLSTGLPGCVAGTAYAVALTNYLAVAVFDDAALAGETALCAELALRRVALGLTAGAARYGSRRGG